MTDELHLEHPASIDPDETLSLDEAHEGVHEHVTNFWSMTWVFLILLFLTALTVWTSNMHVIVIGNTTNEFGPTPHIVMAMIIAVIKATLVAAYFMHLKYDKPMNTVVVGATIFGVVLFIGLTLADLNSRHLIDRFEYAPGVLGGDEHFDVEGERVDGLGIVEAARQAAAAAHAEGEHAEGDHPPEFADQEESHRLDDSHSDEGGDDSPDDH